ncbi:tRNA pseudouridine synthase Pus10 [Aplysia californica]|uniref:tRNA pseudouridine(55) synthase n=1 Tax=Aplysia californica TaxID=6500 RepID=A0ABM0JGX1_APLCA|nr:tRNA pseudouridine synthase Pus10 [Aplysia californica]
MAAPMPMDICGVGVGAGSFTYDEQTDLKLKEFDLFTSSHEESRQVALHLHSVGCCPRCILRLLGESHPSSYRATPQDLERIFLPKEKWSSSSDTHTNPCSTCLGILQQYADKSFFKKLAGKVKQENFEFHDHQCSLILPVSLIVRQKAAFVDLKRKFGDIYVGKEERISSVKDVWKWACGPPVADLLQSKFQNRASFDILMTFTYADSDKECTFLLDIYPDTFYRRKQRKFGFETFTRANVANALAYTDNSKFEDCSPCPPPLPTVECECTVTCNHEAVFIAGRYQKYSRVLSQTPWVIDGKRAMEGSVQELVCDQILQTFRPTEHRLSSSGREDVDVRMLGLGRPFVVELINPHCTRFSVEEIAALQKRINASTSDVQVRDLQTVSRVETEKLKEGEIDKTKKYSAFCWCERELTDADLEKLSAIKDLTLHQKTPLRVLHRRTAATRDRVVHSMRAEKLSPNRFKLQLTTQAGTYIKEFVHGDFGRTSPNMSELLGAECDITDLDVEAVDVDWPPYIDPVPAEDSEDTAKSQAVTSDTVNAEPVPDATDCRQTQDPCGVTATSDTVNAAPVPDVTDRRQTQDPCDVNTAPDKTIDCDVVAANTNSTTPLCGSE